MARKTYTTEPIIGILREVEVRLAQGEKAARDYGPAATERADPAARRLRRQHGRRTGLGVEWDY